MSELPRTNPRTNSEAGRNQAEAEEGGGPTKGYVEQAMNAGYAAVGYGIERGKWVWLQIRKAGARVLGTECLMKILCESERGRFRCLLVRSGGGNALGYLQVDRYLLHVTMNFAKKM